jgi:2-hydroxychromene-2-carboxylate isomerase
MIDFWVSVGSTYSYLSVMRLASVARANGVTFRWRPFSVRAIMIGQNNIPFRGKPVKAAYMWRDIARRAQMYGLSPRLPAPYPLAEFDLANRIAVLGELEGWHADYIRAAYRQRFEQGHEAGSEPGRSLALREIGKDPALAVETAQGADVEARYHALTEEAKALGVFGSPSFVVEGEVFWGDDRLDDAISWFKHRRVIAHRSGP